MEKFLNIIRLQASMMNNARASTCLGSVIAYDENNYYANVELYPNPANPNLPLTSGWLPIFSPWVGNGWGFFAPPSIGDIVEVHFQEGSFQNGYIGQRCFQLGQNNSVPSGEMWLVHSSGSYIKLTNDGHISINSNSVSLGNLSTTLSGFLNSVAQGVYNSHTHTVSGGVTAPPTQQMGSSSLTTNVTGN